MVFRLLLAVNTYAVPVMENEIIIEGKVKGYSIISSELVGIEPAQTLYRLTVQTNGTDKTDKFKGYFSESTNYILEIYSKENLSKDLFGKEIEVLIKYAGDEKRVIFWIKKIVK